MKGKIKTAEDILKENFHNGKYYEIHSGDFSLITDLMQEYAEQFIDLAANNTNIVRFESNSQQNKLKKSIRGIKNLIK